MSRRKSNPNQFTIEEAQTATLINTEGYFRCHRTKVVTDKTYRYRYPSVRVSTCDKEALRPR